MATKRDDIVLPETILVGRKWSTELCRVDALTYNQQWALRTHLSHIEGGQSVLEEFGFIKEQDTYFTRGQPETIWRGTGANAHIDVHLVGLGHWQLFVNNRQNKGTRYTENLRSTIMKVAVY